MPRLKRRSTSRVGLLSYSALLATVLNGLSMPPPLGHLPCRARDQNRRADRHGWIDEQRARHTALLGGDMQRSTRRDAPSWCTYYADSTMTGIQVAPPRS